MPRKPLSEKPPAVRSRLRKNAAKAERDIHMLYKPLDEWDTEELARGRPRNRSGTFTGPRAGWVTPAIAKEAQDRLKSLTREQLTAYSGDALKVMHNLMMNEDTDYDTGKAIVPPNVRLSAAQYLLDQTIGKPTSAVEITGNVKLDSLLAVVMVDDEEGTITHPVIEGEVDDDDTPRSE